MRRLARSTSASAAVMAIAGRTLPEGTDTRDFEAAAIACRPYLLRVAMVQLRDRDLAEDVVQETLLSAFGGLDRFEGQSTVKTWLTAILKHKVLDALRRRKRDPVDASALEGELDLGDIDEFFASQGERAWENGPGPWGDPAAAWEEKRFFDMVDFCLQRLPASTARAFTMRELFEMETREICRELSITESNFRVLMYRARMALRACLESNWFLQPSEN